MRPALIGKTGEARSSEMSGTEPTFERRQHPKTGLITDTDRSLKPEIGTAGREAETISYNLPARKLQCVVKNVSPRQN